MSNILIAGDLLPTATNIHLFESGNVKELFGDEILSLFEKSDYRIINLEGVITDSNAAIPKSGPCLKASEKAFNGILGLAVNTISLANNHIMDYGEEGLKSTLRLINKAGISYVGVGDNRKLAGKPIAFSMPGGIKVGLLSMAEYEFTIATDDKPGANPFDAWEIAGILEDLKKRTDYIIILYHGGKEYYRYPAPYVQSRCRKMIEKGANLVICQHSHCIGCKEEYKSGVIVYGQGNFIFDRGNDAFRNSGLLISVNPEKGKLTFHPVVKRENRVRLADQKEKDEILDGFYRRSEEIAQEGFICAEYEKFVQNMFQLYLTNSFGFLGRGLRKLHLEFLLKYFYKSKDNLWLINALRCEAHRDLWMEGLLLDNIKRNRKG